MRVGADLGAEVRRGRRDSHCADRAQIGDDIAAGVRDGCPHLPGRGGAVESDDRNPEWVRLVFGVSGSDGEERRSTKGQENEPLHRTTRVGRGRAGLNARSLV